MQMSYLYSSDLPFKYTRQTSRNRSQKQVLVMIKHFLGNSQIDQLRYIKIQSQTIDLRARLLGINLTNSVVIPQSLVLSWSVVSGKTLTFQNCLLGFAVAHHSSPQTTISLNTLKGVALGTRMQFLILDG